MLAALVISSLRVLTWCCVILLAILSLLPAEEMVRTGLPGRLEHFVAYAGSAAIAVAGYGATRGSAQIIGGLWVYAGILEYLQHLSPGRHPAIEDFAASALGALCGGLPLPCFGGVCPSGRVEAPIRAMGEHGCRPVPQSLGSAIRRGANGLRATCQGYGSFLRYRG